MGDRVRELAGEVTSVDGDAADTARERHLRLTKPPGSLGCLEELGALLSGMAGQCPAPVSEHDDGEHLPERRKVIEGIYRLRSELPGDVQRVFNEHEAAGTTESQEYQAVFQEHFLQRNVCKIPLPECFGRAFQKTNAEVYLALHGPSWFELTGEYKDWDVTKRLQEIQVPTLVTVGRDDQCVPELSGTLHERIEGSELVVFEKSSHLPFFEEPERHTQVVDEFVTRADALAKLAA